MSFSHSEPRSKGDKSRLATEYLEANPDGERAQEEDENRVASECEFRLTGSSLA